MHLNGKNRKILFNGRKLHRNEQMDKIYVYENILSAPAPAIYMYMTIIFKHLLL